MMSQDNTYIELAPQSGESCKHSFCLPSWECANCKEMPLKIDELFSVVPAGRLTQDGFEAHFFEELAKSEERSFWFLARNKLINWAIKKYADRSRDFLEIGCGTGFVLKSISENFENMNIYGSELFHEGLGFAKLRVPNAQLFQMDARIIPFDKQFDCIGSFDVLEHIDEDSAVLAQIHKALKENGILLLTVPQHSWLWGPSDDFAHHIRRYEQAELLLKLRENKFRILDSRSFVSLLLPLLIASRAWQKIQRTDPRAEMNASTGLFHPFFEIMSLERWLIERGMKSPWGGSLLVVAQKS